MKSTDTSRTSSRSRGIRLQHGCYPAGYPVHVILGCHQRRPVFRNPNLAAPLFAIVADHSKTQACCLMPDHLHWLIADAASMRRLVQSFKSYSTHAARTLGHKSRVWQRSYRDHVVRRDEDLNEVAQYIIRNPVRKGIVNDLREYPYQIVKI